MFSTKVLRFAVAATVLFLSAGSALAQASKEVLNVNTITTWPPYEFKDPVSNKLVGFDIDIMEAIAAKTGAKVNWVEASFAQLVSFNSIKTKRVDVAIAGLADLPDYRGSVDMLGYLYDNSMFYTLRSNASRFPNMDAMCGKTVGVTRSSIMYNTGVKKWSDEHCVKAGKPPINIMGTDSAAHARLQLDQGRTDLAVAGATTLIYQNSIDGNRYMTIGQPFFRVLNFIALPKDDPKLGQALKRGLDQVIADGTYQKLLKKWNIPEGSAVENPSINAGH